MTIQADPPTATEVPFTTTFEGWCAETGRRPDDWSWLCFQHVRQTPPTSTRGRQDVA